MWIAISGTPGSGKNFISETLVRNSYEFIEDPTFSQEGLSQIDIELRFSWARLRTQLDAYDLINRKNIVTHKTFWDSKVFVELAYRFEKISQKEFSLFNFFYDQIKDRLQPPNALIWMKTPRMNAYNRMLLRTGEVQMNDLEFSALQDLYEKFVSDVKIPVIEIDANQKTEELKKELEFGLSSIQATRGDSHSVWKRRFFY